MDLYFVDVAGTAAVFGSVWAQPAHSQGQSSMSVVGCLQPVNVTIFGYFSGTLLQLAGCAVFLGIIPSEAKDPSSIEFRSNFDRTLIGTKHPERFTARNQRSQ